MTTPPSHQTLEIEAEKYPLNMNIYTSYDPVIPLRGDTQKSGSRMFIVVYCQWLNTKSLQIVIK